VHTPRPIFLAPRQCPTVSRLRDRGEGEGWDREREREKNRVNREGVGNVRSQWRGVSVKRREDLGGGEGTRVSGEGEGELPAFWDSMWDPDCNILSLSLSLSPYY